MAGHGSFLLTSAGDWPMLIFTLKLALGVIGSLFSLIVALVVAFWVDFRRQFTKHEKDADKKCTQCHAGIEGDFDNVWLAIDHCCPRSSVDFRGEKKSVGGCVE